MTINSSFLKAAAALLVVCLAAVACAATPVVRPVGTASGESASAAGGVSSSIGHEQAVTQLMSEAFLPRDQASCVIDAVFDTVGTYDMNSVEARSIDQPLLVTECLGGTRTSSEATSQGAVINRTAAPTPTPVPAFQLTEASQPAIKPGFVGVGTVTIDGTAIEYANTIPSNFQVGSSAPVLLAFPPGGQTLDFALEMISVLGPEAQRRGWVLVVPVVPPGRWWDDGNADLVPGFVSWINAWVNVEGGEVHLGGMSNGGISAFKFAAQNPTGYASLTVYPGFPDDRRTVAAMTEFDFPVRVWVGANDDGWVDEIVPSVPAMKEAGVDAEAFLLPGEGHVIQSIRDGVAIFNQLDAAR